MNVECHLGPYLFYALFYQVFIGLKKYLINFHDEIINIIT